MVVATAARCRFNKALYTVDKLINFIPIIFGYIRQLSQLPIEVVRGFDLLMVCVITLLNTFKKGFMLRSGF